VKTNTKIGKIGWISIVSLILLSLFLGQSSVYADTTTSGGDLTGVQIREIWTIHQGVYPEGATDLEFKLRQKEDNIYVNGWNLTISGFTTSSSNRDGLHAVDVTAGGANIPFCTWVTVEGDFWLTNKNTKFMEAYWTRQGDPQPKKKAMPKHGWEFNDPRPDPKNPGQYLHLFCITNDDTTDYLNVTGLAFNATMDWYDDLTTISLPSPYPNFTLAPGESWCTNITTSGTLGGGHIYFTYSITGSGIISIELGDHPVSMPPPPPVGGIVELPGIEEPGATVPYSSGHNYGALAGIIAGATVGVTALISAAWYIRRRRTKATR